MIENIAIYRYTVAPLITTYMYANEVGYSKGYVGIYYTLREQPEWQSMSKMCHNATALKVQ